MSYFLFVSLPCTVSICKLCGLGKYHWPVGLMLDYLIHLSMGKGVTLTFQILLAHNPWLIMETSSYII